MDASVCSGTRPKRIANNQITMVWGARKAVINIFRCKSAGYQVFDR